jgi:two-component response regulator (extracellular proteinase response regulator)
MVREGLRRILEFDGEIQVIDEADNGEECIKKIRSSKPDIVLLDINMPVMNGIEALQEIRKKKLKTKVIILTVHNEIEYLLRAVDIGIDGYVLKDSDAHELIRAVTSVYEGDKFIQPSLIPLLNSKLIARDLDAERLEQLSKREIEVLKLVAVGMFNKEIGVELGISERTVKNHLSSIFKKIDSSDRTQAAVFAIRNGLVDIK